MRTVRRPSPLPWLLAVALCFGATASWARGLEISCAGEGRVRVLLPAAPTEVERTAARELVHYLSEATGAAFEVGAESAGDTAQDGAIFLGDTEAARRAGIDVTSMGDEAWIVLGDGRSLFLAGGAARGPLYAVHRFLERVVGVRWWTPWEESVPHRPNLSVGRLRLTGEPVFSYRDLHRTMGPLAFRARSALNGHFSRLGGDWGGSLRYGPPFHVHTFDLYLPADRFFDEHPEYFSEIGGFRYGGEAQLCVTRAAVAEVLAAKVLDSIEQSRERDPDDPPLTFGVSQNDRGNACECAACRAATDREGAHSGPLIRFVNRIAGRVAEAHPEVAITTLAYGYTFEPPEYAHAADNVIVRFAGLYHRDFSLPLVHRDNRRVLEALRGWPAHADRLRSWDYPVIFGPDGDLPLPNLEIVAADLREYVRLGIEGVFLQHEFPVGGDWRDLKQWVFLNLLRDPSLEADRLAREFIDGYYGEAAPPLRRYRRSLRKRLARHPSRLLFKADAAAYGYLDDDFLLRAQRLFDRATRRVARNEVRLRRVRAARLSVDRATLARWSPALEADLDRRAIETRYRETSTFEIDRRLPAGEHEDALQKLNDHLDRWRDRHERVSRGRR